jgi:hypothetical protein
MSPVLYQNIETSSHYATTANAGTPLFIQPSTWKSFARSQRKIHVDFEFKSTFEYLYRETRNNESNML